MCCRDWARRYGSEMAQNSPPGFGDLLGLLGGVNPLAGISKSVGQFQRGVSDFLSAVENFNKTMEQMRGIANRVNSLLDTVEEPIKAFVPQVTRTLKAADAMVEQLSAPIDRVAPGLARLADTLSSPMLTTLPADLSEFMKVLSDLAQRLQPLGQIAESAGSMFGLRPLAGLLGGAPRPAAPTAVVPPTPVPTATTAKKAAAKKAAAKKAPAKKTPAKKAAKR
jgi:ABC-type transporter Mla subunit MlaD